MATNKEKIIWEFTPEEFSYIVYVLGKESDFFHLYCKMETKLKGLDVSNEWEGYRIA